MSAQQTPGGYYYAANNICAAEHGGTHLDAPLHFAEGRESTDRIPLDRLIGEAAVVDVSEQAARDRDYRVDAKALEDWEAAHGPIGEETIVLIRTDWSKFWPDRARYLGTTKTGPEAVAELHFPGIDSTAAAWLVRRKVKAVGIDTPSIDYGQSTDFMTHRLLFAENIPAFENVSQPRQASGDRQHGRCASDEDQERQRRAAADRGPRFLNPCSHCFPALIRKITIPR